MDPSKKWAGRRQPHGGLQPLRLANCDRFSSTEADETSVIALVKDLIGRHQWLG